MRMYSPWILPKSEIHYGGLYGDSLSHLFLVQNTNITVQKIISNVLSYLDVSIEIKINGIISTDENSLL